MQPTLNSQAARHVLWWVEPHLVVMAPVPRISSLPSLWERAPGRLDFLAPRLPFGGMLINIGRRIGGHHRLPTVLDSIYKLAGPYAHRCCVARPPEPSPQPPGRGLPEPAAPVSRCIRSVSQATIAVGIDITGQRPSLICRIRSSTGLLYRYVQVLLDTVAASRKPGYPSNISYVICCPGCSAFAARASNYISSLE